jgi:cytochrome b6-f complex iron-sulfur subunit
MRSNGPDPRRRLGRRGFLAVATRLLLWATGGAAAAGLSRYLSYERPATSPQLFTLDDPSAYPTGTVTLIEAAGAAIFRDERGYFARSLTCVHLGCRVRSAGDGGFACPCHGSRFAREGDRLAGPAAHGLDSLALTLDDQGRLVLDVSSTVDPAWRFQPASAVAGGRGGAGSGG